jgi:hypothetical protein
MTPSVNLSRCVIGLGIRQDSDFCEFRYVLSMKEWERIIDTTIYIAALAVVGITVIAWMLGLIR